jgi:hypothetical protein
LGAIVKKLALRGGLSCPGSAASKPVGCVSSCCGTTGKRRPGVLAVLLLSTDCMSTVETLFIEQVTKRLIINALLADCCLLLTDRRLADD